MQANACVNTVPAAMPVPARRVVGFDARRIFGAAVGAYAGGWKWYADAGHAPPACEPVFPFRESSPEPVRTAADAPRFALLFARGGR
jgi:hypothetical protein